MSIALFLFSCYDLDYRRSTLCLGTQPDIQRLSWVIEQRVESSGVITRSKQLSSESMRPSSLFGSFFFFLFRLKTAQEQHCVFCKIFT